ncbi:MAG: hypothetical protein KTR17_05680, partial [Cellvibrionaceae bacterium]|nr:hypothetical protein [Cellvibrionaceae bacterium]
MTNSFAQPKHVAFRHNRLKVNNRGKISVLERVEGRFFRLNANLSPTDDANITSFIADEHEVGSLKPANFDKVPWSSSQARLRSNDPALHWTLRKACECAKKQKSLILSGFDALKHRGRYCITPVPFLRKRKESEKESEKEKE